MLPLFFRTVFPASHNLVWLGFMLLFPAAVLGQAGGSPPIVFHAADPVNAAGSAGGEHPAKLPAGVLKLASEEQFLLWVELEIGRLSILERNEQGGMELREEIPVSIGKNGFGKQLEGDHKTPVGIYRLTSFLPDANLDDYYGLAHSR